MQLFRNLTPSELPEFRQWARDNYTPGEPINPIWHPVVATECRRMNEDAGLVVTEEDPSIIAAEMQALESMNAFLTAFSS